MPSRPASAAPPSARASAPTSAMIVIALCVIVTSSSASSLNLALPSVAAGTGATQTQLLWIVDAYTVPMAGLLLAAGAVGDRFGRRLVLVVGLSVFGVGALVASFVDSPTALIVCRLAMGCAGALILPTTLSVITTTLPPERRATAVGTWVGLAGAGAVVGMLSSAILLEFFDWNSVFVLTVVLVAAALGGVLFVLPRGETPSSTPFDLGGALLSLIGISGIVVGLLVGPDRGWDDPVTIVALVVGAVALGSMVWHELRSSAPMLDPRIFALRGVEVGTVTNLLVSMGTYGFMFMFTQYLQYVGGLSTMKVVLVMLPFVVVVMPLARFAPSVVDRFGAKATATTGFLAAAIGFTVCLGLEVDLHYAVLFTGVIGMGVGVALVSTPATSSIVEALPPEKQGVASSLGQTARKISGSVGIALIGAVLNAGYSDSIAGVTPPQTPAPVAEQAQASIVAAQAIASHAGPYGQAINDAAAQAFVDGFHEALVAAIVISLVGACYALWRSPSKGVRPERPVSR